MVAPNVEFLGLPHSGQSGQRIYKAAIIDQEGLWTDAIDVLPSFEGRVRWSKSMATAGVQNVDLIIELVTQLGHADSLTRNSKGGRITVLVDATAAIDHENCGPLFVCTSASMQRSVLATIGAIFTVALADHIVAFEWEELLNVLSRDTLLVAEQVTNADANVIAACATRSLGYFQGTSRIEPEAVLFGLNTSKQRSPKVSEMVEVASLLRAMVGRHSYQMSGYLLTDTQEETAFILVTFPIPALPGGPVRPRLRWPR